MLLLEHMEYECCQANLHATTQPEISGIGKMQRQLSLTSLSYATPCLFQVEALAALLTLETKVMVML